MQLFLTTFLSFLVGGCGFIQSFDLYIPDMRHLQYWIPEIVDDSYKYDGIYANHDTDTLMFLIVDNDVDEFHQHFDEYAESKLTENGWVAEGNGIFHKYRGGGSCSIIKLAKRVDTDAWVLGFVEGSCRGPFTYENISSFGAFRWAKSQFWPKFEQSVEGIELVPNR